MASVITRMRRWMLRSPAELAPEPILERKPESDDGAPTIEAKSLCAAVNGAIAVMDNHLLVKNPDLGGVFATVTIPDDPVLTVMLDGLHCTGQTFVTAEQEVQIDFQQIAPVRRFTYRVSRDAMNVFVRVDVIAGYTYHLRNVSERHHVLLETEGVEVYPDAGDADTIVAELLTTYKGLVDRSGVERLCQIRESAEIPALRGIHARRSKPARYKPVRLPKVYDPIHRRMRVATVSTGVTVALYEPGIPGVPGVDVFGRAVPVPHNRALQKLGQGVIEVSGQVIAMRNGRFVYTRGLIDVVPELVIPHDLTSKDGKVEFDGDVIVLGTVQDGSFIQATGSVEVHGSIFGAAVFGERGVYVVDSIVGSDVVGGQSRLIYQNLFPKVRKCALAFRRFQVEHGELWEHGKKRPDAQSRLPLLADLLMAKRHGHLEQVIADLVQDSEHIADGDDRYRQLVGELRMRWTGIGRTHILVQDVTSIRTLLDSYMLHIESLMSTVVAEVKAASAASSKIRCAGKIAITGSGLYMSTVEASDSIVVRGSVRGGSLVAQNLIRARELGTVSGARTTARVLHPNGKIALSVRHPNTLLQVGDHSTLSEIPQSVTVLRGGRQS
ncbi:MAG: FapA family protein [Firmicutes bacterium]|nr:FapA family protein [Bacillota bacterium]